jgi:hypothetical protein
MPYPVVSVFVLAAAVFTLAAGTPAAGQTFVFHLAGDQEAPPVPSPATGGCHGAFDGTDTLDLVCVHNVSGATLMHVHRGAAGVNGPVAFDLGDPTSPVSATWTGMTPADVADLVAGDLYINVHTGGRPAGEIRGQLLERTVDFVPFSMDGDQEVPPSGSAATGSCTADLSADATALQIDCTHDVAAPTEAHLHQAPAGEEGPVVHTFASPASPISEAVPVGPVEVAAFAARHLYVNIHSTDAAEGEIRGQIGTPPAPPTTGTIHIRKATFPAGGTGFGFTDDVPGSPGSSPWTTAASRPSPACLPAPTPSPRTTRAQRPAATPSPTSTATTPTAPATASPAPRPSPSRPARPSPAPSRTRRWAAPGSPSSSTSPASRRCRLSRARPPAAAWASSTSPPPRSPWSAPTTWSAPPILHVHRGAPGVNGPIAFDLGEPSSPVLAEWTGMSPGDVADLLAGNLYVNIHTGGRPTGEIRGQIVARSRDTFHFPLTGSQQVPPVVTPAFGSVLRGPERRGDGALPRVHHTVVGATAAHIHQAPAGENGPVLIELGDPASPFSLNPAL